MKRKSKEIPNTKNVVVWPDEILDQIRLVEAYDRVQKRASAERKSVSGGQSIDDEHRRHTIISENAEYYLFLIFGSMIWILVARAILKWQQFPFQRHMIEVCLIYTCPILFIILLLYFVDFGTNILKRK